jgi:hypothetical protein
MCRNAESVRHQISASFRQINKCWADNVNACTFPALKIVQDDFEVSDEVAFHRPKKVDLSI